MTYKNAKTLLPVLTIALVATMSLIATDPAYASTFGNWASGTQYYYCHSTLSQLDTTSNINECSDLSVAAGTWNVVSNSNWNFNKHSSYTSGDIIVAPSTSSQYLAMFQYSPTSANPITSGTQFISTQYTLGNHAAGDSGVLDYHTLMIHEFGHVAGLDHTWWPWSVMIEGQSTSDQRLSLDWTDESDLQGLY